MSDDPEVLRQQLMDMAGPGAVIRVDSFEGAALPNKSQIRSIRISRDQFAAEFHAAGGINVEIITQPGMGPMRMNVNYRLLGDSLSGRSPFVPERGPEEQSQSRHRRRRHADQEQELVQLLHQRRRTAAQTPNINIVTPDGEHRSEAMAIQSHNDGFNGNLNVDYALTIDQTLRFGLGYNTFENRNQGIGGWDREERAVRAREPQRPVHDAADRPARPPRVPADPHALLVERQRERRRDRGADRAGPRCVHGGRRRRSPAASIRRR